MKKQVELIGICSRLRKLEFGIEDDFRTDNSSEITLTIGVIGEDGKPRNYQHDLEAPVCAGDHSGRFYACHSKWSKSVYWSTHGPEISFENKTEVYRVAWQSMVKVDKALAAMYATRGNAQTPIEECSRWLEACKVKRVFVRPADQDNSWHNKGTWDQMSSGDFISRLRDLIPASERKEQATA